MARPNSSAFRWINTGALNAWQTAIDQFTQMSSVDVVTKAAHAGGRIVKTHMQDMIYGQSSLGDYSDVAERVDVFDAENNVWVGIKDDDPVLPRALEMDRVMPVLETVFDLERQTGDAYREFEQSLIDQTF